MNHDEVDVAEAQDARDNLSRAILDLLSQPFPADKIKYREAGNSGKQLAYLETMTVIEHLNEHAPRWNLTIIDQSIHPFGQTSRGSQRLLLKATVSLYIEGIGSRSHVGVQVVNAEDGGEDLWKGAVSDALKKAASLFGVGKELYSDPEPIPLSVYPQNFPQQSQQQGAQQPQQSYQPPQGGGNMGGAASQKQLDLLMKLAYERGYKFEDFKDATSYSKQQASKAIEKLMAENRVNPLEQGQVPPNEWYNIPF